MRFAVSWRRARQRRQSAKYAGHVPDHEAPVVRNGEDGRELIKMHGPEAPPSK